jgi:hypothetical protein
MTTYPYPDGDVLVLGPEIFASTPVPKADTVISWRGENFAVQTAPVSDGITIQRSDLEKIRDALAAAARHHISRDESNAALHLAPVTRYSPLTSTLEAEHERAERLLEG